MDAAGVKAANRGEWIRHQWKVRRGYLKVHVAVDIEQKQEDPGVGGGDGRTGDGRMDAQALAEETSR